MPIKGNIRNTPPRNNDRLFTVGEVIAMVLIYVGSAVIALAGIWMIVNHI